MKNIKTEVEDKSSTEMEVTEGESVSYPKPTIFYKYHPINPHLISLLQSGKFYACHQKDLNDIRDCKYGFSETYLNTLFDRSLDKMYTEMEMIRPELTGWPRELFKNSMMSYNTDKEFMNGFHNMMFGDLGFRIICFSTDPTNELMWSHYADRHRGVCLEFDFENNIDISRIISQVCYTDIFPVINSVDDILDAVWTKRTAWSYEKEWRVISQFQEFVDFKKESLKTVYFGANVTQEIIDEIRVKMIDAGYKNVDFKQFDLYINRVKFTYDPNLPFMRGIK